MARRSAVFVLLFSVLALMPFIVQAQEYKAGTLGYLYADCKAALEKSKSFEALYRSWCGAFVEGYVVGVLSANGLEFKNTKEKDACWGARQAEYDRINNRLCPNLPAFDQDMSDPSYMLEATVNVAARWLSYLDSRAKARDPLDAPISTVINDMLRPGAFCDVLGEHKADGTPVPTINPALLDAGNMDALRFLRSLKAQDKYKQCQADLKFADGDEALFARTRCYSEIEGFITGVQSTAHLQEGRDTPPADCRKEIDRLYNALDVRQSMCVRGDTEALRVAQIYVDHYDLLKTPEGYNPFFDPSDIQSVGYNVIYRGFLCLKGGRD